MYDAIVVGARCAGSPTAMLLARRGWRVLLVDRAVFPSDTLSTHFIWSPGVACLKRWGMLEPVLATNCPVVGTFGPDLGEFQLTGNVPPSDGVGETCAPRRAEWLSEAVHAGLADAQPIGEALADMQALFHALRDNPVERDRYFGTLGGTVPIPEYYAPENLQRIVAGSTAAVSDATRAAQA